VIDAEFRPIETWPGEMTPEGKRQQSRFSANYSDTLNDLDRELAHLRAKLVVIEVALKPGQIRLDGWPKSGATAPTHPGVIVSFESKHGPLRYATDAFKGSGYGGYLVGWQANIRAIALSLEALRRLDRYGVSGRGEQYTGWSALPPGSIAAGAPVMTVQEAAAFLIDAAGLTPGHDISGPDAVIDSAINRAEAYRRAAKHLHPDAGGTTTDFQKLEDAKRILDGATR